MEHQRDMSRFMAKVVKSEVGCWLWTARKTPRGYGRFHFHGKDGYAHRAAMALFHGIDVPADKLVMHSCDNPSCVNPAHLSIGTQYDNMQDAAKKGRTINKTDWRGSKNPRSKLSEGDLERIYRLLDDCVGTGEIARTFGVTRERIQQLRRKRAGG